MTLLFGALLLAGLLIVLVVTGILSGLEGLGSLLNHLRPSERQFRAGTPGVPRKQTRSRLHPHLPRSDILVCRGE
jgi:hypothetical protein